MVVKEATYKEKNAFLTPFLKYRTEYNRCFCLCKSFKNVYRNTSPQAKYTVIYYIFKFLCFINLTLCCVCIKSKF